MFRPRRWPFADWLVAGLLWLGIAAAARADALASPGGGLATERLVLAATVNGQPAAEPVLVRRQGPAVWMRTADLRRLGIAVPSDGVDTLLDAVPGLRFSINDATQTIELAQGKPAVQRVRINGPPAPDRAPVTPGGWGGVLNYDLSATSTPRATTAAGLVDAVLYGPHGYAYASALVSSDRTATGRHAARLDTGVTIADPNRARRLTIGDIISSSTDRGRPVRMTGVQASTDWSLRPDLVTAPLPSIGGEAAVPSAVDLVVNGARQTAGSVKAGQFAVTDVPVQAGVNSITVAVRDALGRETRQTVSTYGSHDLLRPGLTAFSLEAGLVRTGYGTAADRYDAAAASGTLRRGLSGRLTLEAHAEVAPRVASGELAATAGMGWWGLASASVAASAPWRAGRGGGVSWSIGYQRLSRPVSVTARYLRYSRDWHDLASDGGGITRSHQLVVNIGLDLAQAGTAGLSVIDLGAGHLDRLAPGQDRVAGVSTGGDALGRSTLAVATYSVRLLHRFNIVGNLGADLCRRASAYLSLGALMTFGNRSSGYAGVLARSRGTGATADYQRSAIVPGDLGYRVDLAAGGVDRVAAGVAYQGMQGRVEAEVERTDRQVAARVEGRGALIVADGAVLAADRLFDGFAVVDTGRAGITVYRDNRAVGVTGRSGRLVVPNLRAFEQTKLSINPFELDADELIDAADTVVTPPERAGVPVRFNLRASRAALVRVLGTDGAPVPAGSRAAVNGAGDLPVGMDGELWAPDLLPANTLLIRLPGGAICSARFPAPAHLRPGVILGPVTCAAVTVARR